jgi:hypothetical protein
MSLTVRTAFADAVALWRGERDLLLRIAGMFYLVPIFGLLIVLLSSIHLPEQATVQEAQAAVEASYRGHVLLIFFVTLVLEFGNFVLLRLFLQAGGSTVGGLLRDGLRWFLPFMGISILCGVLFQLGLTLFLLPGAYIFGRSWLVGAAYAAAPERGPFVAVQRGVALSARNGWRLAAIGALALVPCLIVGLIGTVFLGVVAGIAGDTVVTSGLLWLVIALVGSLGYLAFTLLRVAAYRRLASSGI